MNVASEERTGAPQCVHTVMHRYSRNASEKGVYIRKGVNGTVAVLEGVRRWRWRYAR